jgi:regulator of cell morphogenesis and NO signaling
MEFNKTDKMVHLIQTNYHLLPIFHRFGFRLGFGNKTVEQLCKETDINADFFLTIVNTFHNKSYFPKERLLSFSPLLILDYLKKTHQYYKNYSLPKIETILHQLLTAIENKNADMQMIEEFYFDYKVKLLKHIDDEENIVFPYIEKLVNTPENVMNKTLNLNFEKEHENVDLEIDDLKNLILKYIVPNYDELVCNELIAEIFRFEKDILDHARIEDNILIPQVEQLQERL